MPHYVIIHSMPGYLPESDPYVFSTDEELNAVPQILECLREEVERMADSDAMSLEDDDPVMLAWDAVLSEIERDKDNAADFDESGFLYHLPGPLVIEATRYTASELIGLGYSPDFDGVDFGAHGLVEPEDWQSEPTASDGSDELDFTPYPNEIGSAVRALNFRRAYGRD